MNIKKIITNQVAKKMLERIINSPAFDYFDNHKGRPNHQGGSLPRTESEQALSRGSAKHSGTRLVNNQVEASTGVTGAQIRNFAVKKGMAERTENRQKDASGKFVGGASMPVFTHTVDKNDLKKVKEGAVFYGGGDGANGAKMYIYHNRQWVSNVEGQLEILHKNDIEGMTGVVLSTDEVEGLVTERGKRARASTKSLEAGKSGELEKRYGFSGKVKKCLGRSGESNSMTLIKETSGTKPLSAEEKQYLELAEGLQGKNLDKFNECLNTLVDEDNSRIMFSKDKKEAKKQQLKFKSQIKLINQLTSIVASRTLESDAYTAKAIDISEFGKIHPDLEGKSMEEIVAMAKENKIGAFRYKGFWTSNSNGDSVKAGEGQLKVITVYPKGARMYGREESFADAKCGENSLGQLNQRFGGIAWSEKHNALIMIANQ